MGRGGAAASPDAQPDEARRLRQIAEARAAEARAAEGRAVEDRERAGQVAPVRAGADPAGRNAQDRTGRSAGAPG